MKIFIMSVIDLAFVLSVADIRGLVHPILYEKTVVVIARVDDTVVVPCVAYANPRPSYRSVALHSAATF